MAFAASVHAKAIELIKLSIEMTTAAGSGHPTSAASLAHLVTVRRSEIGVRMALGASPGAVMRMVLGHGRRLTLIGIVVGIAGALAVSRLLQETLFEVDAASPRIYLALSVFLLLVTECASWLPARRSTRIDPVIALRAE